MIGEVSYFSIPAAPQTIDRQQEQNKSKSLMKKKSSYRKRLRSIYPMYKVEDEYEKQDENKE